jgi:hypothetical protein
VAGLRVEHVVQSLQQRIVTFRIVHHVSQQQDVNTAP